MGLPDELLEHHPEKAGTALASEAAPWRTPARSVALIQRKGLSTSGASWHVGLDAYNSGHDDRGPAAYGIDSKGTSGTPTPLKRTWIVCSLQRAGSIQIHGLCI